MSGADRGEHDRKVTVVDRQVAHHVRLRRQEMGLTQHQLADLIGVTYQQVHKYERGINRISAGQLHAIALVLGTNVPHFFEDLEPEPVAPGRQDNQQPLVELLHNVQRIGSPGHRQAVCAMARALVDRSEPQPAERS